jgi:hypothetical protein
MPAQGAALPDTLDTKFGVLKRDKNVSTNSAAEAGGAVRLRQHRDCFALALAVRVGNCAPRVPVRSEGRDDIMNPMPKPRRNRPAPVDDATFSAKPRKALPCEFVLEGLAGIRYITRPMFGCLAVYVKEKIVLVLRDKPAAISSNGVWLATTREHHESLRNEFPGMRSIPALGSGITGWQMLPSDAPDFEESAMRACELIVAGDPRIGKMPQGRRRGPKAARRSA